MPEAVTDNSARQRFELAVDGSVAFITYTRSPGVLSFDHTEVPQALAGKGVGSQLARGALASARRQNVKVVPRCSFVADFIRKHPEFEDLLDHAT